MFAYVLKRIAIAISVVAATLVASFMLFFIAPHDPVSAVCGQKCTPQRVADITKSLHLDDPWYVQFGAYFKGLFVDRTYTTGGLDKVCEAPCLGYSYRSSRPVSDAVWDALGVTASIVLVSAVLYVGIGLLIGIWAARRRGRPADRISIGTSLIINSVPYPVVALLAAVFVGGVILPQEKWVPLTEDPAGWAKGLLVAWVALTVISIGSYTRYARNSMIESLSEDFTRTARAKGISENRVVYRHALRAGITPIVTLFGLDIAISLSGAFFTEFIFGLPGLGVLTIRALTQYDLPMIMGGVLVSAIILVALNLIVDLLYAVLDPRVRLS